MTAYIARTAQVSDTAQVYGSARVSGSAWVYGSARVYGYAQVYGYAWVYGDAQVAGTAQVSDTAQVYGSARVYGYAQVYGYAWVYGDAQVAGTAQVYGSARVSGTARVSGDAQVYGDARVHGTAQVSGHGDLSHPRHLLTVGPVGSEHRTVTIHRTRPADGVWGHQIVAGCWAGTVDQLAERIAADPWGDATADEVARWTDDYQGVIALARTRIAEWEAEPVTPADLARWNLEETPLTTPSLSGAEAATVARFDAAPDADESLRERVAVALYEATEAVEYVEWPDAGETVTATAYAMADAAIAVMRGQS